MLTMTGRWILTRHPPIESHLRTVSSPLAPSEVQRHVHITCKVHEELEGVRRVREAALTVQEPRDRARLIPHGGEHVRVATSAPAALAGEGARSPR